MLYGTEFDPYREVVSTKQGGVVGAGGKQALIVVWKTSFNSVSAQLSEEWAIGFLRKWRTRYWTSEHV